MKASFQKDWVEIHVSTMRKSAMKALAYGLVFPFVPLYILIAYLGQAGIISLGVFLLLVIGYATAFLSLFYEDLMGIFPKSRRMQKILMEACDRVVNSSGGVGEGGYKLTVKWVKTRQPRSFKEQLRHLELFSWPDMVDPSEFTKQQS